MDKDLNNEEKQRLPPGQHEIERFPVLQKGKIAHINREKYILKISGEVNNPKTYSLEELESMQNRDAVVDIHCVTSWSKFNTKWEGISFNYLFERIDPKPSANFVEFECADGSFTTTVPIKQLKEKNCLLALKYNGEPISDEHGGPVRALIPHLYFYKSAKWVLKINLLK
ncbi:MAG: sulfite oxidase-like oxidoreductase, partial [Promethearchaeota archaeon]